jgi:hypothetical protein
VLNELLLDIIMKVPFGSVNISDMGKTIVKSNIDTNPVLHFTQLESVYKNNIVLKNPVLNDTPNPDKDFKNVNFYLLSLGISAKVRKGYFKADINTEEFRENKIFKIKYCIFYRDALPLPS